MKVKVISDKFGAYKIGDEIEMHESTAKAVALSGKVEIVDTDAENAKAKKKGDK